MNDPTLTECLDSIPTGELIELLAGDERFQNEDLGSHTIEQLGNRLLPEAIDGPGIEYAFAPRYWSQLKAEFHKLLCSDDRKYESLRKDITRKGAKLGQPIVYSISGAMASQFGITAGVMVPFCAMILLAIAKMGKEAYCAASELNVTPGGAEPPKRRGQRGRSQRPVEEA